LKQEDRGQIVIYQRKGSGAELRVTLKDETLWLNQYQIADLFETDRTSILKHIKNIYATRELSKTSTCAKFAQVQIVLNRN